MMMFTIIIITIYYSYNIFPAKTSQNTQQIGGSAPFLIFRQPHNNVLCWTTHKIRCHVFLLVNLAIKFLPSVRSPGETHLSDFWPGLL